MLYGFIGRVSMANQLKEGLDEGALRVRRIADRVSKATLGAGDGFSLPQPGAIPGAPEGGVAEGEVDLESEMVSLADAQLRYEATSKLLEKTYAQIRASLRDRG